MTTLEKNRSFVEISYNLFVIKINNMMIINNNLKFKLGLFIFFIRYKKLFKIQSVTRRLY